MFQELGMFSDSIGMFSSDVNPLPAPSLNLDFTTGTLDSRITYTRAQAVANTVTYTGSNGLIQYATANTARFDYNPITLACNGLLIEESRANILTYSSDLTHSPWGLRTGTVTSSISAVTAPDGSSFYTQLTKTGSVDGAWQQPFTATVGTIYTGSICVSKSSPTVVCEIAVRTAFSVTNGEVYGDLNVITGAYAIRSGIGTMTVTDKGTYWYVTVTTSATSGTFIDSSFIIRPAIGSTVGSFSPTATGSVYVWGAQLEAGSFATSLIQTTTTSITRNADSASMTGTNFSSWWNTAQGTMLAEFNIPYNKSNMGVFQVWESGSSRVAINVITDNTFSYDFQPGFAGGQSGFVAGVFNKSAVSLKIGSPIEASNGVISGSFGSLTGIPASSSTLYIGKRVSDLQMSGWIKRLLYYPTALVSSQIKGLTS